MRISEYNIGDLVYIKRKPEFWYSWHRDCPRTNFIGMVMSKIDGYSYSIVYLRIVYPDKKKTAWMGWNTPQRKKNYWDYSSTDLKSKVDLTKLSSNAYSKILARVM